MPGKTPEAGKIQALPLEHQEFFRPSMASDAPAKRDQLQGMSLFGSLTMSLMFLPSRLTTTLSMAREQIQIKMQLSAQRCGYLFLHLHWALQLAQATRPLRLSNRTETGQRQGAGRERTVGCRRTLSPVMPGPWTRPPTVLSADTLGSALGDEELMGKVLGPNMSNRRGGKGVGVSGAQAPPPWGRAQSLTYPSAKGHLP